MASFRNRLRRRIDNRYIGYVRTYVRYLVTDTATYKLTGYNLNDLMRTTDYRSFSAPCKAITSKQQLGQLFGMPSPNFLQGLQ